MGKRALLILMLISYEFSDFDSYDRLLIQQRHIYSLLVHALRLFGFLLKGTVVIQSCGDLLENIFRARVDWIFGLDNWGHFNHQERAKQKSIFKHSLVL